jgi:hypothetical protein
VEAVPAKASGEFRRSPIERTDQRVSWERDDQAFFAAGACHILAWACRDAYAEQPISLAALRAPDRPHVFHTYAVWQGWAFDHAGWNPERALVEVNERFEGRPLERVEVTLEMPAFCEREYHQMPEHYWRDPRPRADEYVARFRPPWAG